MRNPDDYRAGWTTTTVNPRTGKQCSGGAARNLRTAQAGGAVGIYNTGFIHALQYMQPMVERLEAQLKESSELNKQFVQLLAAQSKNRDRSR